MSTVLRQVFDDINLTGRRYVFTGGGDSTWSRGNGFGEWGGFLNAAVQYAPCIGGFAGFNVSAAGGQNYLHAIRRTNNTASGATTTPADAECLGGVVCPSGWLGFQHCLLAAAGTTITSSNWNWTANQAFFNVFGRVVVSVFSRDLSGAADANTGYTPALAGGSTLDVQASPNGVRQAIVTTDTKSISGVSVANPTTITTSTAHGYATGDKVVITGTNTSATTVGTFTATVTGATTFTIPVNVTSVTTGTGSVSRYIAITSARQITSISVHATDPTITTESAHGYTTGDTVVLSSTNSTPAIDGSYTITVTGSTTFTVSATTTVGGTAGFANDSTLSGTLRRMDIESQQVTTTSTSGAGASVATGDGGVGLQLGGPALFLYQALTSKDTPKGWWASKHISLGGKSLLSYIIAHINTTSMKDSVETYFKCMLLLNDPTYANAYGGCQGDVSPGGLGGADLAIGCLWVDAFGHNDAGTDANSTSLIPSAFPAWAIAASTTIVSVNTGAGTVDLTDASSFATSGHIHVNDGEIITYSGKSSNQLTGCTFATYGTSAGSRTGTVYQGYNGTSATGFASNMAFWDEWLRARWAAAGGAATNLKHIWKAPMPSHDETSVVSGPITTLPEREQRHREMVAAVRSHNPSPLFEVVDPRDLITARDMVNNRWADVSLSVTLTASGVTSTTGDTINCNAGLSTQGVGMIGGECFKWTGKSGNNPTGCTRGAFGTTAYDTGTPSHTSGKEVVELDMIHSSTMGYYEFWRLLFAAELQYPAPTANRVPRGSQDVTA